MRCVSHANFRHLQKVGSAFWSLLFIPVFAFVGTGQVHAGLNPTVIYSDGSTPIIIQVNATANQEDTQVSGVPEGDSSLGYMLYPTGSTPSPSGGIITAMPSPGPTAGPGCPTEFGTYSTPPTQGPDPGDSAGTRTSGGFGFSDANMIANVNFGVVPQGLYQVLDPGTIVQASPPYTGQGVAGPITSRWIYTNSIAVVNPIPVPNNYLHTTVYVSASPATATKGANDKLVYTFTRNNATSNYTQPLTAYFSVGGTAPSSDYTLSGSSPVTFAAGSTTAQQQVIATPVNNGVYDSGVTVVVTVQSDHASPTTYAPGNAATGTILSPNRPPTIQWTTGGISQYGTNPINQSVSISPGQTISVSAHAKDLDGNLAAIYVDAGSDTPPTSGNAWHYVNVSGGAGDSSQNFTGNTPGDQWFSVRSMDTAGVFSPTNYLRVHVDAPPQVAWQGLGAYGQNVSTTINVGQSVSVQPVYYDADTTGNAQLLYTWASSTASGSFTDNDGPRAANTSTFRRYWNSSANPNFTPTVPGTYYFYAAASDGMVQPPPITLTVTVPNRPPTIAWAVPGAYQVNANTWELDLPGASTPALIAASGADPDGRMGAVLINRGTGDPTQNQGTPFAQVPGGYASGTMTPDEMRPPLQTTLDSAAFEQSNQDNYSWFSAGSYDQDGGVSAPVHLLVRVFNQPPSNAVWTNPASPTPINATDSQATVYPNSAAFPLTATSSDPEQKMWVALINNIYNAPQAGNPTGNEVGVGYSPTGVNATASFTPGAETFDVVGDHWFSAIGIDDGIDYSGGAAKIASHLDVKVVNRPPTASFASTPTGVNVNQPVVLKGIGADPDNAMKRVQVQVVSAPASAGIVAGQVVGDTSVPAAQQVYPSNVPTWKTDGPMTPPYSGTYTVRVIAWDRHGGTGRADMNFTVINRPPVFAWTANNLHVLAGDTLQLPYTVADPDGNLGIATATGPSGYTAQASYPNASSGSGSFPFSSPTPGTYTITGAAFDRENLESLTTPTITVIVEPINTAPVATFTSPAPGGTNSTVTHFVDDVVSVGASATDVDGNLSTLQITLGGATWAQAPASGNVSTLATSGSFTVPVLAGAETSHTYTFGATATDSGTIPGGLIPQPSKSSPTASLKIVVPNRAPTVQWTVPTGGVGLTQSTPYTGYLLQPLQITAHGIDRDGNLAAESIIQVNSANPVLNDASSPDGRTGDVSYRFTPTVPGMYIFAAQAYDKAGATSEQVMLYIQVQDYPSDSTGTIGALIVSPATSISQVFAPGSLPIVVKGGVAALGRPSRATMFSASTGVGASKIVPVPNYLNGTQIPPLAPPILDLRTVTVAPTVDHDDPSTGNN